MQIEYDDEVSRFPSYKDESFVQPSGGHHLDEQREFVQTLDTIGWDRTPSNVVENATSIKLGENKQNWNYAIIIIPNGQNA